MVDDIRKAATVGDMVDDRPCFTASAMPGHNGEPIAVMSWHRGEPIAVRLEKVEDGSMAQAPPRLPTACARHVAAGGIPGHCFPGNPAHRRAGRDADGAPSIGSRSSPFLRRPGRRASVARPPFSLNNRQPQHRDLEHR